MAGDDVVMFLYSDLSGVARGRGFPVSDLRERLRTGVGWVPADQALTPTGAIADPNPWGSMGDLRLLAEPDSRVRVDYAELGVDAPTLHFYLCDAVTPELAPWDSCVRAFCKDALDALRATAGLDVECSFEQEFHLSGPTFSPGVAFSMDAYRRAGDLGPVLVGALRTAGQEPETVLPEYGTAQYEINCRPVVGVLAADRAAAVREVTRDVARQLGLHASFTPVYDPEDAANGVHVHLSLRASDGSPATYDPAGRARLSESAAAFTAGVLEHLPALCALTAPNPMSYIRLSPHRWSAAYRCVGERNREAAVRIYPGVEAAGLDLARQLNLEYRAADAAASPHLVLGAIVRAGLEGIKAGLPLPELVQQDPSELTEDERRRRGVDRLPQSLPLALEALEADDVVRSWFSKDLWSCYLSLKRTELALADELTPDDLREQYLRVY